jgi:hypothetical protein
MRTAGTLLMVGALVAATLADDCSAARGGRGGSAGRSAAFGASRSGTMHSPGWRAPAHMHHHHFRSGGAFFVGGTYWPYFPTPYYYPAPYYVIPYQQDPATVYVERFDGTPTPQTPGEIFCPNSDSYYPDAQSCPGGWQRVIRPQSEAPADG